MTSALIDNPRLEEGHILGVIDSLKKSPKLQSITITSPAAFNGLPHHSSLRCVHLRDIARESGDWSWVANNRDLNEIAVSFKNGSEGLNFQGENYKVQFTSDTGTMNLLENLPGHLLGKVFYSIIDNFISMNSVIFWSFSVH